MGQNRLQLGQCQTRLDRGRHIFRGVFEDAVESAQINRDDFFTPCVSLSQRGL